MEQKTLTQEELQQLKDIRSQVLQLASTLGEISYQEVLIGIDKAKIAESIKEVRLKEQTLFAEFGKKYGDGVVNIETGEIEAK
jgi:hypothetical protein